MANSIRASATQTEQRRHFDEAFRSQSKIPFYGFVSEEVRMVNVWFASDKESDAEMAAASDYIRQQHSHPVLLYRLMVQPWFGK